MAASRMGTPVAPIRYGRPAERRPGIRGRRAREAVGQVLSVLAEDVDGEPAGGGDHRVDLPSPTDADEDERRVEGEAG